MCFYVATYILLVLLFFSQSRIIPRRKYATKNTFLRVQNGRDSPIGEFPYVVRMEMDMQLLIANGTKKLSLGLPVCTCAQIAPAWTLTAAHCIGGLISELIDMEDLWNSKGVQGFFRGIVRYWDVGDLSLNKTGVILKMFEHPSYDEEKMGNDIGLLKTSDVHMKNYGKISAVDHNTLIGLRATIVGFGNMNAMVNGTIVFEDTWILKKPLQAADVMIKKCDMKLFPLKYRYTMTSICLASPCGKVVSVCGGDSGGPLIQGGQIVGVNTAASVANCQVERDSRIDPYFALEAGFINPVSPYIDWITLTIRKFDG